MDIDFIYSFFVLLYKKKHLFQNKNPKQIYPNLPFQTIFSFLLHSKRLFFLNIFLGTMELKLRATINTTLSTSPTHQSTTGKRNAFDDVVVSEDAEFIPIGTGGATATDVFTLDVTLAGVDQLKGIATTISGPYYLTYGMFGVVTETDTFDSLSHPIFHPIVDSFRVQR